MLILKMLKLTVYFQKLQTQFTTITLLSELIVLIGPEGDDQKHISDVDYIPSIIVLMHI